MNTLLKQITQKLADELRINAQQVNTFITLYDDGNTVPFIARYRKEMTQGLDDTQLRLLETRLTYLRELSARRISIIKKIDDDGKLTDKLN
ncbi:MAG: Tex-like N-terminal domain-containing protein, partial [Psychromonas sp.]